MKKASSIVLALFMAAGMAFAQTGGGAGKASTELNPQPLPPGKKMEASKTNASGKKATKKGAKSKKGASTNTATQTK